MKHLQKKYPELNLGAETLPAVDDYQQILLNLVPIIDVRSPREFAQGATPNAVNLPFLSDDERKEVGTAYREGGQTKAVSRGLELLPKQKQAKLISGWIQFLQRHPNALICCWRGGLRSRIVQAWLNESGWTVPRVVGGSKALRSFCLAAIDSASQFNYVVVAGRTGTGKTLLIKALQPSVDFEGIARHRGSAFGGDTAVQPTPVNFESSLAQSLLRVKNSTSILVEDESRVIGKLALPDSLFKRMGESPVVVLQADDKTRLSHIYEAYVEGTAEETMIANLEKIQKRLGLERYEEVRSSMQHAYRTCDRENHFAWLALLLKYYYDPMYDYQLTRKQERVIYRGSQSAVKKFLMTEFEFNSSST